MPRGARHHGLDKQGHDILVVGEIDVDLAHGIREGVVPAFEFALCDDVRFLDASGKGGNQCLLQRGGVSGQRQRPINMAAAECSAFNSFSFAEVRPGHVVERACSKCDAPVKHGAPWIVGQSGPETGQTFLLVETEAPVQSLVEQALSLA